MTFLRLVISSLAYHVRIHAAVALGVLAATGVLTGALLVGDSMRGSLRRLVLERLGNIEEILVVDRFFRAELAEELVKQSAFAESGYETAIPLIVLSSTSIEK